MSDQLEDGRSDSKDEQVMAAFEVLAWFIQYTCGIQDRGSQAEQTPGWR